MKTNWRSECEARNRLFTKVYDDYFKIMPDKLEALMLCSLERRQHFLANQQDALEKKDKDKKRNRKIDKKNGSFYCTVKFLNHPKHPPMWSEKEQRTRLKSLADRGFITINLRKSQRGTSRWITINYDQINQAIEEDRNREIVQSKVKIKMEVLKALEHARA